MKRRQSIVTALLTLLLLTNHAAAAPSINLVIDEGDESASHIVEGSTLTLSLAIKHSGLTNPFSLPRTPGLVVNGSGSDPHSGRYTFFVTPSRVGDYTIPAFDIRSGSGKALHVNALKFHVFAN